MPNDNKTLTYNQGEKSLKALAIIYAKCLLEKMRSYQNNLEKSYTKKKTKHTPSKHKHTPSKHTHTPYSKKQT